MPLSHAILAMVLALGLPGGGVAQSLLNWSADDGARIAALEKAGRRIEGRSMVVWHPVSLPPSNADRLLRRLDPAIAALRARVGTHPWQVVPTERITFYLSDDTFVSHATGKAAVFVPMARVLDGRAPYLHEAAHELLASSAVDPAPPGGGPPQRRPLWLTEGLPDYVAELVATEVGMTETGPFATGGLRGADTVCADRARTADGATMLPFVGGPGRPDVLFTTDRARFAPTFYTCALSFTKFLADRAGLDALVALFGVPPSQAAAGLDALGDGPLAAHRAAWLAAIGLP
ncbi:MAG: hypothetical protein AB7U83_08505 [Vicinamibacterales bacterium]